MVTQLLHNYRSLPSILSTYSNLSYDSKLIANISATDSDEQRLLAKVQQTIHKTSMLKHKENYGVYFIGVNSRNETVPDSTSWRNPQEVVEVSADFFLEQNRTRYVNDHMVDMERIFTNIDSIYLKKTRLSLLCISCSNADSLKMTSAL